MTNIRRIVVNSADRSRGDAYDFAFPLTEQHLNVFAGKTVRFALEWITPVIGSDFEAAYGFNEDHPMSIILLCGSFQSTNQYKNFENNNDTAVAMLHSFKSTGYHGRTADTPYVQSSACGGLCLGDQLATLSELEFRFKETQTRDNTGVFPWTPDYMEDFEFSIVFWEEEPERALVPSFYHLWLSTGSADVVSGGGVYTIPFQIPAMVRDQEGWQMAVSFCSPVFLPAGSPTGLVITSGMIQTDTDNQRRILAFLPDSGDGYYGQKWSVKPVCQDTLGLPIRQLPLDSYAFFNVELRDAVSYDLRTNASHFVFCVTMYK